MRSNRALENGRSQAWLRTLARAVQRERLFMNMPEIPPWFTIVAALACALTSALVAAEVGFGRDSALLLVLAVVFLIASIQSAGGLRKALVWLGSWWQSPP